MVKVIRGFAVILFLAIGTIRVLVDSIRPMPPRKKRHRRRKTKVHAAHTDKTSAYIEAAWEEAQK